MQITPKADVTPNKKNRLGLLIKIIAAALITVYSLNLFTFNYYYIYGHINRGLLMSALASWLRLVCVFFAMCFLATGSKKCKSLFCLLAPIACLLSLIFAKGYLSLKKEIATPLDALYASINDILPARFVPAGYFCEVVLILCLTILLIIENPRFYRGLKSYIWFLPVAALAVMPLNLPSNALGLFGKTFFDFLTYQNFGIWHLLAVMITGILTASIYQLLKNMDPERQRKLLIMLAFVLIIQYQSKLSMLIGDGYSLSRTLYSAIPLYICNTGVYIAAASVIFKKRRLYAASFFVHGGGAVSVFIYLGGHNISDFGTALSYSYIYFVVTHALLFALCLMPTLLKHYKFTLNQIIFPLVFFGLFILAAATASAAISSIRYQYFNDEETIIIEPNFAFTQRSPFPFNVDFFPKIKLFGLQFNLLHLVMTYLMYLGIFFAFYGTYLLVNRIIKSQKIKQNRENKQTETPYK